MTVASIHQVPRHHHRQFMLVSLLFSENFRLSVFLFYQSQSWPSFSLQSPPPSRVESVNTVSESLLPTRPSLLLSLFFLFLFLFLFLYFDVNCFICLVFCFYFVFVFLILNLLAKGEANVI